MPVTNTLFSLMQGESRSLRYTVTDENDAPLNLTSYSLRWVLAQRKVDNSGFNAPVLTKLSGTVGHMSLGQQNVGVIDVVLKSADTASIPAGVYEYQLTIINGSGEVEPVAVGKILLNHVI